MVRLVFYFVLVVGMSVWHVAVSHAQEAEEKSRLITFVEEQLSSQNRQIRLNGIQGTLSSNVSLNSITIADDEGVWLTITEPQLIWNRSALLRGRLEIESLTAESIVMPRGPLPDESAPSPEAGGFSIPELPVSVVLEKLDVPIARFGQTVFGLETEISLDGAIVLSDGSLDTNLDIVRLDGPGGSLALDVAYDGSAENIDLDVQLREPENGIIANLLNIEGKPPVALAIKGSAPVEVLRVDLALDVDQQRILDGDLRLDGTPDGLRIGADLGGPLSTILSADYAKLMGSTSQLSLDAIRTDLGQIDVSRLTLNSGVIALTADAQILADGFMSALNLDAQIADPQGQFIELPGEDSATSFGNAAINVSYDAELQNRFVQSFKLSDLSAGDITIGSIKLETNGTIANFDDPAARTLTFSTTGALEQIDAADPALAQALGDQIKIAGGGAWSSGAALTISAFDIDGETYAVRTNGDLQAMTFDGQVGLQASSLTSFASLASRDLAGSLGLVATGQIGLISRSFDLEFSGTGNGLQTGTATLDKLLFGSSRLSGGIKRGDDGLSFNRFRVTNNQVDILLDGRYASDLADLEASVDLRELADISDAGSGGVSANASINGQALPYDLALNLAMPSGTLSGKAVENLDITFEGKAGPDLVSGTLLGGGTIDAQPVGVAGQIERNEIELVIDDLTAKIGSADLSVNLVRNNQTALMDGNVAIVATDISAIAALALQNAAGALSADIDLTNRDGKQAASVTAEARDLSLDNNRIGSANISAKIDALLSSPKVDAEIEAINLQLGAIAVRQFDGTIATDGQVTDFDAVALMAQENARVQTKGTLTQSANEQLIALETLDLRSNVGSANLVAPTSISIRDGNTTINNAKVNVAGGTIDVDGSVAADVDLRIALSRLPLSIANAFSAGLDLGGTVEGTIAVFGSTSAPRANFNISGTSVTASQLLQAQISPLNVQSSGSFNGAARSVSIDLLNIANAQDIQLSGSGTIPLGGSGLNFSADGTAPLSIGARFLASRGASLSGQARFNVTAQGALRSPQLGGLLSISGGSLSDPLSNLRLTDIGLIAGLSGNQIAIQQFGAQLSGGGSVTGSGTVGISGDLPANLTMTLKNAGYSDGQTFATTVNGQLALGGSLLRDPVLSGQINVGETEITVPESFASGASLLDVTHNQPDASTQETLQRLRQVTPLPTPSARPSVLQLDLTIIAPNRIFVRGRGLDAEMGGRLLLRGPTTNITPSGRFELRRGRLALLGQRFDIDEGAVTLAGTLDPVLYFVVQTQSGDVTSFITITGRASDIQVSFTSDPELPEDEVLAQIVFGKSLSDLSPTQIARLASAAVELTGGSSPGLVNGLRQGLGLDDLDVVEDSDGNAAVQAGKYINDNVYLGIQTGQETEATINLDVTDSLTARGSVDSEGVTSLGIFFERDY